MNPVQIQLAQTQLAQATEGLTRTQQLLADDPLWLILLKVVGLFGLGVVLTLFMINWERKVVARMQQRPGPNRVGPNGWLQSLADGLKLAFKEDIMPVAADKKVYFIAPVISTIPAFVAFSVIPFGGEVSIFGEPTALQLVDRSPAPLRKGRVIDGGHAPGWAASTCGGSRGQVRMR